MKKMFHERGFEDYSYWEDNDLKKIKKIRRLLKSIERDGVMKGEGKPEKLRYFEDFYSRRIDDENRLIYTVEDEIIIIAACKGHYE